MTLQYLYSHKERRNSVIEDSDGEISTPLFISSSGSNAYTRFFGTASSLIPKFVVKKPTIYPQVYFLLQGKKLKEHIDEITQKYRNEQLVWNSVYPLHKAELFTDGEIRLVLPYLPGEMLNKVISEDPLTRSKQVLAVIYALQRFHELGWVHNDFHLNNVLIEQNLDGSYTAYLIDFAEVGQVNEFSSIKHYWSYLHNLLSTIPNLNDKVYDSFDLLISDLTSEIKRLSEFSNISLSSSL